MIISGQHITIGPKHCILQLHEPYWGAYVEFGWKKKDYGMSVSRGLIDYALEEKKKIGVICREHRYEIDPEEILTWLEKHPQPKPIVNRYGTELVVVPRSMYMALREQVITEVAGFPVDAPVEKVREYQSQMTRQQWEDYVEARWNYPLERLI